VCPCNRNETYKKKKAGTEKELEEINKEKKEIRKGTTKDKKKRRRYLGQHKRRRKGKRKKEIRIERIRTKKKFMDPNIYKGKKKNYKELMEQRDPLNISKYLVSFYLKALIYFM
jgi:hypothetical protein